VVSLSVEQHLEYSCKLSLLCRNNPFFVVTVVCYCSNYRTVIWPGSITVQIIALLFGLAVLQALANPLLHYGIMSKLVAGTISYKTRRNIRM